MADAADTIRKVTLREALKDVGWFPALYTTVVGGPSILAILEMAVDGFQLVPAVQWIVDGYNQITRLMAALIEPLFAPVIAWISRLFGWTLVLHPHWRPLFLLGMVFVASVARTAWRQRDYRSQVTAGGMGFAMLVGAIAAGLVPPSGAWWVQGLLAALMMVVTLVAMVAADLDFSADAWSIIGLGAVFAFAIGVGMTQLSGGLGSGILAWAACIGLMAGICLALGLSGEGPFILVGFSLTVLGGFVTAGLILAADAMAKAFG